MTYIRLALYRFQPGTVDEVIRRGEKELLPMFREQDGFVAYEVVRTGQDTGFAINTWSAREQAEAASARAQGWMREHFAPVLVSAETHVGEVAFSSRTSDAVPVRAATGHA